MFQPGELIGGRYRLQRIIGAGAMGTVWSARNESTDRDFALKLMLPEAAKNPVALQRFFQEAKASGRLRHRSIVEVYDLGRIEGAGTPYLVMELLEGEALDSLLRRHQRLPVGTALRLVEDLARGLDVAHKQGIVHRDLKPANIFLHKTLEGTFVPKILDFGVSKLLTPTTFDAVETSAGTVLGSPAYMSPEQAAGDTNVDGRSDVWSLGVILYKCLAGNVPFSAPNYNALMMAIATKAHPPIESQVDGLPPDVSVIIDRCMSKERDERFESGKDLADAISRLLAQKPNLERVDLTDLVMLHADASLARTLEAPVVEQAGTLAATELAPANPPAAFDKTRQMDLEPPPPSSPSPQGPRVRLFAGAFAALVVLATIVVVSTRDRAPAPTSASAAPEPPPLPALSTFSSPSAPVPVPVVVTEPASEPKPEPSPSVSNKPKPKLPPKPAPKPASPPSGPKPAHEGVTTSGI